MNTIFPSIVEALGWALMHCLWQGAALALVLAALLRALKNARAPLRYAVATIVLGLLVAAFGITFLLCWPEKKTPSPPALAALVGVATPSPVSAPAPAAVASTTTPVSKLPT